MEHSKEYYSEQIIKSLISVLEEYPSGSQSKTVIWRDFFVHMSERSIQIVHKAFIYALTTFSQYCKMTPPYVTNGE